MGTPHFCLIADISPTLQKIVIGYLKNQSNEAKFTTTTSDFDMGDEPTFGETPFDAIIVLEEHEWSPKKRERIARSITELYIYKTTPILWIVATQPQPFINISTQAMFKVPHCKTISFDEEEFVGRNPHAIIATFLRNAHKKQIDAANEKAHVAPI